MSNENVISCEIAYQLNQVQVRWMRTRLKRIAIQKRKPTPSIEPGIWIKGVSSRLGRLAQAVTVLHVFTRDSNGGAITDHLGDLDGVEAGFSGTMGQFWFLFGLMAFLSIRAKWKPQSMPSDVREDEGNTREARLTRPLERGPLAFLASLITGDLTRKKKRQLTLRRCAKRLPWRTWLRGS